MNTYKAFYRGKEIEVKAGTSYGAQCVAFKEFKAKKQHEITIILVALEDGKEIERSADF